MGHSLSTESLAGNEVLHTLLKGTILFTQFQALILILLQDHGGRDCGCREMKIAFAFCLREAYFIMQASNTSALNLTGN
jgi:hypothetical protein